MPVVVRVGRRGPEGPPGPPGTGGGGAGWTPKGTVANVGALPASGNTTGDAYVTLSDNHVRVWSGTAFVDEGPLAPGSALPTGGTTGQALVKSSGTDYAVQWSTITGGSGVPVGGTTGQVLTKNSGTDGDATWATPAVDVEAVRDTLGATLGVADPTRLTVTGDDAGNTVTLDAGPDVPSLGDGNTWAGNQDYSGAGTITHRNGAISAAAIADDLDARFDAYSVAKNRYAVQSYATGTTPPFTPGTLWVKDVATTLAPTPSLVDHSGDTANVATYSAPITGVMAAGSRFYLFVWGGLSTATSGSPTPKPSSVTGRGLAWAALGTGIVTPNGITSHLIFEGTGTPTSSGSLAINFPSAIEGCNWELVAVSNLATGVIQQKYNAPSGSLSAPSVTYDVAATTTDLELVALSTQSGSQTVNTDPGTPLGSSPDFTIASPSISTRVSSRAAQTTDTYATSGLAQKIASKVQLR